MNNIETNVSIQEESASYQSTIPTVHSPIEHLVLVVHGIGKHEDNWVQKLSRINVLFHQVCKITNKDLNVKFVGIEWHTSLHQKTDSFVEKITPPGIPVIRSLVNHTMLDILFFTSPTYSQTIYTEVGNQLNEVYDDFIKKNPTFIGKVSILAHSLGSMICFDLLCNQPENPKVDTITSGNIYQWRKQKASNSTNNNNNSMDIPLLDDRFLSKIDFPKLHFSVHNLYAIGSPIAVLSTCRGHTKLDIPQCVNLYNILDTSDPVAYLIEPLIDENFSKCGESSVTQFSVRKKMVSADSTAAIVFNNTNANPSGPTQSTGQYLLSKLSNKLPKFNRAASKTSITSTTTTTTTVFQTNSNNSIVSKETIEKEMVSMDFSNVVHSNGNSNNSSSNVTPRKSSPDASDDEIIDDLILLQNDTPTTSTPTKINSNNNSFKSESFFGGHRFDFKLKPKGILNFSEYSSVISAHKSYWESKDVMLFIAENLP